MLTHLNNEGKPVMVNVGNKASTERTATARSIIILPAEILAQLTDSELQTKKRSVFQIAVIGGIMAAKRTGELILL